MKKIIFIIVFGLIVSLGFANFTALVPVATSTALPAYSYLYFSTNGTNYAVAVATGTNTFTGTDTTLAYSLSQDDILYGSIGYTSAATTAYTVAYSTGIITYAASLTTAATAVVTYSYFVDTSCAVDAVTLEAITTTQATAFVLVLLSGELYDDQMAIEPTVDLKAILARENIFLIARESD